jgi:VIT1/CCC1 family predicted Fe2+/Mn2+ transporter
MVGGGIALAGMRYSEMADERDARQAIFRTVSIGVATMLLTYIGGSLLG